MYLAHNKKPREHVYIHFIFHSVLWSSEYEYEYEYSKYTGRIDDKLCNLRRWKTTNNQEQLISIGQQFPLN